MVDHLQSAHLLAQAERLAGVSADPGRPRQVDLRRAVSAAYYAVYHEITLRAAAQVVAYDLDVVRSPAPAVHLVRWFSHSALMQATRLTDELSSATRQESWKPARRAAWEVLHDHHPAALPRWLIRTSKRIRDLQEQRNVADYDHVTRISRQQALTAVDDGDRTVRTLQLYSDEPPMQGFLALVALCTPRLPPGL